jgi:pyrroloquinoline quinone biosynthesis protein B
MKSANLQFNATSLLLRPSLTARVFGRSCVSILFAIAIASSAGSPSCSAGDVATRGDAAPSTDRPYLVVLGNAQDAGYPQAGCHKGCCARAWSNPGLRRHASSIAIVDPQRGQRWFLDCTPNFPDQLRLLDRMAPPGQLPGVDGILLTHAHIGHYAGLVHLGREVMGVRRMPVYAMPRMRQFLTRNGPWSQLVAIENIVLQDLANGTTVRLNERIRVTPFLVPHRDEFSETVGFRIEGPDHSAIYLPDIDKWKRWSTSIEDVIAKVDVAFLDGTFFADGELPGRNMSEIPHPFVMETIKRLAKLPASERTKVRFLHLNHTNPLLDANSAASRKVQTDGHHVAQQGEWFGL